MKKLSLNNSWLDKSCLLTKEEKKEALGGSSYDCMIPCQCDQQKPPVVVHVSQCPDYCAVELAPNHCYGL